MKKIQKHVILGAAVLASTGFAHTVTADTTPVDANALQTKIRLYLQVQKLLNSKLSRSIKPKRLLTKPKNRLRLLRLRLKQPRKIMLIQVYKKLRKLKQL